VGKLPGFLSKSGDSNKDLILNADRDVKHGHVVRIMDLAKKAGINSIVIAAQWREEKVL